MLREVRENLRNKPEAASGWKSLRRRVGIEPDVLVFDWPLVFDVAEEGGEEGGGEEGGV